MPEKRNILFVDDEPNVLQGLKRMLRSMRSEWEMSFCSSGQEALKVLAEAAFDVVVSDMQMPGMDGAQLLATVMERHPQIVRIVLSGHSSKESAVKSAGVAHQFLAKPCDPDKLRHTIEHAFALRGLLKDEGLKQTLSQLKSVPSMPALYEELVEELQHPYASIQRAGEIIEQDAGMSVKVLQMVNSAFFGLPRKVSGPAQAVSLLGADTIKSLVLGISVFSQFKGGDIGGLTPESIQEHSATVAAMAKQIAVTEKAGKDVVDASLMGGFLHDVGKLILAQNLPKQYGEVLASVSQQGIALSGAERKVLGGTHAEVGAYLLGLWGLPEPIVEATAFHHHPRESHGHSFSPLTAVHAANVLVYEGTPRSTMIELDLDYLSQLGVADRVATWRAACQHSTKTAEVACE
ncbi:HDOD domain-containing protein [Candidatus Bipolaricaulota bacterium]|nr:HDOD domain-containing protein [Candidatus Bipolaricaulota bacterium]